MGVSVNSRISLNSKTFVISVMNYQRLSLVVFSWSKDVGSVQVLRISLNSEPFVNNPMLRRKHDIISVIRVLSLRIVIH